MKLAAQRRKNGCQYLGRRPCALPAGYGSPPSSPALKPGSHCCRTACSPTNTQQHRQFRKLTYKQAIVDLPGWRRGVVVSGVRRMNDVPSARRARLVPGWVTVFGRVYHLGLCNEPTRSTQPCIPPGSLNRVPASAGVRAGMSPLPGGR